MPNKKERIPERMGGKKQRKKITPKSNVACEWGKQGINGNKRCEILSKK
jgi:hypothetical protein